jgi:hypothetical protein
MNDQVDPRLAAVAKAMDEAGAAKYGPNWRDVIEEVDVVTNRKGLGADTVSKIFTADSPAAALVNETREQLMKASDAGSARAERILRETRAAERESWRKSKGIR